MKKLLVVLLVLGFTGIGYAEVNQEPQKCEVKFEVTYNAITFDKASDVEIELKKRFKDACKVEIKSVKPSGNDTGDLTFTSSKDVWVSE